jgi:hypothetical protein
VPQIAERGRYPARWARARRERGGWAEYSQQQLTGGRHKGLHEGSISVGTWWGQPSANGVSCCTQSGGDKKGAVQASERWDGSTFASCRTPSSATGVQGSGQKQRSCRGGDRRLLGTVSALEKGVDAAGWWEWSSQELHVNIVHPAAPAGSTTQHAALQRSDLRSHAVQLAPSTGAIARNKAAQVPIESCLHPRHGEIAIQRRLACSAPQQGPLDPSICCRTDEQTCLSEPLLPIVPIVALVLRQCSAARLFFAVLGASREK